MQVWRAILLGAGLCIAAVTCHISYLAVDGSQVRLLLDEGAKMSKRWSACLFIFVAACSGCERPIVAQAKVSWKPPFLPVSLSINSEGAVSIEGETSLVTPIGTFSFGAEIPLSKAVDETQIIVRDRVRKTQRVYALKSDGDRLTAQLSVVCSAVPACAAARAQGAGACFETSAR